MMVEVKKSGGREIYRSNARKWRPACWFACGFLAALVAVAAAILL